MVEAAARELASPAPARAHAAIIAAASFATGLASLSFPFGSDQGIYAYLGQSILDGKVPYAEVFQAKPPLTPLIHALALAVFGHPMLSIRLLDFLWTIATALLLHRIAAQALPARLALLAGLLYAPLYYAFGFWDTAITDGWTNLPLLASILCYARALDRGGDPLGARLDWFLAGFFLALAVLLKYSLATVGLLLALWGLWRLAGNWRRVVDAAIWSSLGFAIPVAATGVTLLAAGAWPAFIESQTVMVGDYGVMRAADIPFEAALAPIVVLVGKWRAVLGAAVIGLGLLARMCASADRDGRTITPLFILLWCVAAYASAWVQGKYFDYHMLPLVPALAIAAALGFAFIASPPIEFQKGAGARAAIVAALALGTLLETGIAAGGYDALRLASGRVSWSDHIRSERFVHENFSLPDIVDTAARLRAITKPDERIFVWSIDPMVYFLAERDSASRFIYDFPLSATWAPAKFRAELLRDLNAGPPAAFVVQRRIAAPKLFGHTMGGYESWLAFTELHDFVMRNYRLETEIGSFVIFRRNST